MRSLALAAVAATLVAGCNESRTSPATSAALPKLAVSFAWCQGTSPSFQVSGIPAGSKVLELRMKDRQVPQWNHGGGDVPVKGASMAIPCGTISGVYNGPNPPGREVHDYDWTVTARDANGAPTAVGTASRKYPQ
ncbi:phospholipid-binding protein [Bosea sp. (in: a-proteobacteria)]|uniref:phospholipid-binding protein n=1 Tax=Bosea sp. (in: a-proteobacteria) TaxID=1871050 RepID=UPI00261E0DAE|nr:phospholipid-binding protein [Bosea sp. (in: a-proteobacteria)]MCO5092191.1 phospholipid-binding protein [Bosea sp. (in: a-proteobacteria)]